MPGQQPQTRRERRLLEELAATGALPPLDTPQPPGLDTPAPSIAPPVVREPEPPQPSEQPGAPLGSVVTAPSPAPAPAAPLTRRQLREQLRQPATDAMPPVSATADQTRPPVPPPWETPQAPASPPVAVEQPRSGVSAPAPEAPVEADDATPAPLPPVFASPVTSAEDAQLAQARTVGPAAPATNALILPVAPPMDVTGPLGDTGEVLVTGNIPLPKHVVETGITGIIDTDLDDDSDFVGADSGVFTQPVRAVQAVSSRSLELDAPMIKRPRWGAVSLALGISAAVLGVTAVSLLALALLTDIVQIPL